MYHKRSTLLIEGSLLATLFDIKAHFTPKPILDENVWREVNLLPHSLDLDNKKTTSLSIQAQRAPEALMFD